MLGIVLFVAICAVMRPFLMAAFVLAAFGAPVVYRFSPRFRNWLDATG